jgi:hypothetical protein
LIWHDLARELRRSLTDVATLCSRLGIACKREGAGFKAHCPWHEEHSPSCSIRIGPDGTISIRCHGCGVGGDALSLIAIAHRLDVKRDFREVLRIAVDLAGRWDLRDDVDAPRQPTQIPTRALARAMLPERDYPPVDEVSAVWKAAGYVADDAGARTMLEGRALDVEAIDERSLARVLPSSAGLPRWARFAGQSWTEIGHRLVLPVYNAAGQMRSLRAWRVGEGDTPKRLPPSGHKASGLVLADPFAVGVLAAGARVAGMPDPIRLVVTEGEPDFLVWATRFSDADERAPIVLGIGSGSWTDALASRIPSGSRVIIRTDHDPAGDRYAEQVRASLATRCDVRRSRPAPRKEAA